MNLFTYSLCILGDLPENSRLFDRGLHVFAVSLENESYLFF